MLCCRQASLRHRPSLGENQRRGIPSCLLGLGRLGRTGLYLPLRVRARLGRVAVPVKKQKSKTYQKKNSAFLSGLSFGARVVKFGLEHQLHMIKGLLVHELLHRGRVGLSFTGFQAHRGSLAGLLMGLALGP